MQYRAMIQLNWAISSHVAYVTMQHTIVDRYVSLIPIVTTISSILPY